MNPYPSYKNSGVEWVGEIPSGWEVEKIKYILWERKELNKPVKMDNLLSLTLDKGVIPHSEKGSGGNKPKEDISKYKLVYPGDIVLNSMNVIVGSVGVSKYSGIVSPVYYILNINNKHDNIMFFHHLFRGECFQKSLIGLGNGILIKHSENSGKINTIRMRIPMDKLNQQRVPYPSNIEQQQISNYLDHKTQQIDSLIEKTEQTIELLKEQRTSLINQVVTKGLNPDVEMKDSGVEWIGKIPSGWIIHRLVTIGDFSKGKNITKDELRKVGHPCILYSQLYTLYDRLVTSVNSFVDNDKYSETTKVSSGTFLFTSSGETVEDIGKCILYNGVSDISVGGDMVVFKINDGKTLHKIFLSYVFNSGFFQFQKSANSRGEIVVHLYERQLRDIRLPIPPPKEQQQIVDYLDKETTKIDTLIEKENQRIDLLKEYRQSLISEVVTGKVDVRDEVVG